MQEKIIDQTKGAKVAIADFIHSCGSAFSISEHPKFCSICKVMMKMTNSFMFPNCTPVAGKFLDKMIKYIKKYIKQNF